MKLKKLELVGFKSFANRISLKFDEGITAIVGPNGSGKSNISDAVRWVLGEQSAKSLRGSKMEDIIFAGSDGKKPLGMAEVQLTLDNADGFLPVDFNEVTITRRVYRNGESEFLINKQSCRLKDIHDMLTDTGLGREGYAIISQGQIDTVLSVRSYDRRVLLEETAGIIKYRYRKEEALAKMEKTNQDLNRVLDILRELKSQQGPLGKEAEKARYYLDYKGKLDEVELDYFSLSLNSLETKREQIQAEYQENQRHYEGLNQDCEIQEKATEEAQQKAARLSAILEQTHDKLAEYNDKLNSVLHSEELTKQKLESMQERHTELTRQQKQRLAEKSELDQAFKRAQEHLNEALTRYKEADEKLKTEEEKLNHSKEELEITRNKVENLKDRFFDFMRNLSEQRNLITTKKQELRSIEGQLQKAKSDLEQLKKESAKIDQEILAHQVALQKLEAELKERTQEGLKLKARQEEMLLGLDKLRTELGKHNQTSHRLESRLNTLQDLEREYEGYNYGVRTLMQKSPPKTTLIGTVADVIKVPEGLEIAFEIAFGASLQNIITPTQQDAKQAIGYLKAKRAGRVTFLPLDSMRGQFFPESYVKYWQHPKVLGPALELVEFDDQFRSAIASLIGRVVITEDLDTALALSRELPSFSRIVTKEGDLVTPSGAITGGTANNRTSGLLSRKNEIQTISQSLVQEKEIISSLNQKLRQTEEEISQISASLESLRDQAGDTKTQIQRKQDEISRLHSTEQKLASEEKEKLASYQELTKTAEETKADLAATTEAVVGLEQEEKDRRQEIQQSEANLRLLEKVINSANERLTQGKIERAELQGGLNQLRTKLKDIQDRQSRLTQLEKDCAQELDSLQCKQEELEESLKEYVYHQEQYRRLTHKTRAEIDQLKENQNGCQKELTDANEQLKVLRGNLNQTQKSLHSLELQLNKIELESQRIVEELAQRDCIPEKILHRKVSQKKDILQDQMYRLRAKIKELGMVNPQAVEEYAALTERIEFLETQVADLREAQAALMKVIDEMDATSKQRFAETFEKVRKEFSSLFIKLFQGGKADLKLTDPEDLLSTGIEILAQPPGKKLQNLLLLSGGERSLTAIALLFAIRRVKPTPFCILDEIDAALDDSNLARFAKLMREFSAHTQFLVITHRQGTMEEAHCLYGVTMAESAVSQLMSVKLAQ